MSTELVPTKDDKSRDGVATADVVGTANMVGGELSLRIRPTYRDASTRPIPPTAERPSALSGVASMRYVGPCSSAEAAEHRRVVAWCAAHPVLAWLRGWNR